MRKIFTFGVLFVLTACLEPQPAPEVPALKMTAYGFEGIAEGFASPWSVAELPNGDFLVTERGGRLFKISNGFKTEIKNLPDDIFVMGQGGLLEVAIPSDFSETNEVYISYAYGTADANGTALIRAKLDDTALKAPTVIFRASPSKTAASHFGGRIVFLPDDTLILTLGDGFAYREEAQKLDTHLGKIVRLMRDGSPPEDNPELGGKKEIYSYGHRNIQGLAYDVETDTLWSHEHGPRGGDELNVINPGENYGWPITTKGLDYNGAKISPFESYKGMIEPIHVWIPSIAPSGLIIYRGEMFPNWQGDAFIGGLASKDIRHLDLDGQKPVGEMKLLQTFNWRIRDLKEASDGAILVLTDDPEDGKLLRITPKN